MRITPGDIRGYHHIGTKGYAKALTDLLERAGLDGEFHFCLFEIKTGKVAKKYFLPAPFWLVVQPQDGRPGEVYIALQEARRHVKFIIWPAHGQVSDLDMRTRIECLPDVLSNDPIRSMLTLEHLDEQAFDEMVTGEIVYYDLLRVVADDKNVMWSMPEVEVILGAAEADFSRDCRSEMEWPDRSSLMLYFRKLDCGPYTVSDHFWDRAQYIVGLSEKLREFLAPELRMLLERIKAAQCEARSEAGRLTEEAVRFEGIGKQFAPARSVIETRIRELEEEMGKLQTQLDEMREQEHESAASVSRSLTDAEEGEIWAATVGSIVRSRAAKELMEIYQL